MDTKNIKIGKYLTDLKELPTESKEKSEGDVQRKDFKPKIEEVVDKSMMEVSKPEQLKKIKGEKESEIINSQKQREKEKVNTYIDLDDLDKPFTTKDIILGAINLISIIFLIVLLVKLPDLASQLNILQVEKLKLSDTSTQGSVSLGDNEKKADELALLFLDDSGIVDFVADIERLKTDNPAVKKVSFTSQKAVKDKLKLDGIPAIIDLEGDWSQIGNALEAIQTLPYLFRPVNIKAQPSVADPNVILFNYGGILYVGDKFTKN